MTKELKTCPFCGGNGSYSNAGFGFIVKCRKCGSKTSIQESGKEAAEAWNTRPIENELEEENARLREALQMIATEKDNHGQWLSVEQAAQIAKDTLDGGLI